jgi:leucyl aminopeptidase
MDITAYKGGALVVNLFHKVKTPGGATGAVDKALGGIITAMIKDGQIKGALEETTVIPTYGKIGASRVVVAGLGKKEEFDPDRARRATAAALKAARGAGMKKAATILHGAGAGGLDPRDAAQAVTEGALLGLYKFDKYKSVTKEDQPAELGELTIVERDSGRVSAIRAGVKMGTVMAQAAILARDLVNEPPNVLTPVEMDRRARAALKGLPVTVKSLGRKDLEKHKMGAYLGVTIGSVQEPRLIIMEYKGNPASKKTLALIGKGVTFDSGGLSLKPSNSMAGMKGDMAGAASVIGAMTAIAKLGPKINVTAYAPCVENMPDGAAQRVDDIRTAMNGKTIEIANTDAEGRLILVDTICYAKKQGADAIVDAATLTGACVAALGETRAGAFTNDEKLLAQVMAASDKTGEKLWHMPTDDEYKEMNKSQIADIKNVGGKYAGATTAALFLEFFVEKTPWVHLDIAGVYMFDKPRGYYAAGGTGQVARTLAQLALDCKL